MLARSSLAIRILSFFPSFLPLLLFPLFFLSDLSFSLIGGNSNPTILSNHRLESIVGFEFPPMREKERSDKKKRGKRSKGRKEGKKERIRIAREERASISKGFRCKHLKEIQASL